MTLSAIYTPAIIDFFKRWSNLGGGGGGEGGDLHSGATYILAIMVSATLIYSGTTGQKVKIGTQEIGKYFRAP